MNPTQCLQLIQHYAPEIQINSYRFDDTGWDNFAVIINAEWLFRFPRKEEYAKKLQGSNYYTTGCHLNCKQAALPFRTIIFCIEKAMC